MSLSHGQRGLVTSWRGHCHGQGWQPPLFSLPQAEMKEVGDNDIPLADRSLLGTTVNILCSTVPVFWA